MLAQSSQDEDVRLVAVRGGIGAVPGVEAAGVHAGIKPRKRDLALVVFKEPQVCASVITTNEIKAAPLLVSEEHLRNDGLMRAIVCNSGCANACTGERGDRDARATARQAAALLKIPVTSVIVASTGVIGVPMPMDRVQRGLERAVEQLETGLKSSNDAAESIMTTDRVPKLAAYEFYIDDKKYTVGGIAKGSGMIAPHMATMLAFVATNLPMPAGALKKELHEAADATFNMISVDGCMSTNDACYAFAPPGDKEPPPAFAKALQHVCLDLALAMVADGEGASKTMTMHVTGAKSVAQARTIGRAIINSNLVKTALYGEDPNWGRIIAAAGSVNAGLDPETWSILLNGKTWVEVGAIEALSEAEAHTELEVTDIVVELRLGLGDARATAWGCDLSKDYVRINASYRT